MAFLDSSSSVIDAILTNKGRELLAKNDGSFKITKFAFGDDEINYQLYDANNATNPDKDILNLPVFEPVSNEQVALRSRLITLDKGSSRISTLVLNPSKATVDYNTIVSFTVSTDNGEDSQGYSIFSRNTDIASPVSKTVLPNDEGIATFQLDTGSNAGSEAGTVILDVIGLNTGARSTFELTVSPSES